MEGEPAKEFHDDGKEFDGNSRVFNSFAEAIRSGGEKTPLTDIRQIQNVTRFINDCYEACGWRIKKAPWSATETLFRDIISGVFAERKTPASSFAHPPAWA